MNWTGLITPRLADNLCLLAAVLLPVLLVLRYDKVGVVLGTLVAWGTLNLAGILLSGMDPTREEAMLDSLWLLLGWFPSGVYCLAIYAAKRVMLWLVRRASRRDKPRMAVDELE